MATWELDGLTVRETSRRSGAVWRWESQSSDPIEYEIEWVEDKDVFLYGTRVKPGGWSVSRLDPDTWTNDGSLEGAREVVERRFPTMPH